MKRLLFLAISLSGLYLAGCKKGDNNTPIETKTHLLMMDIHDNGTVKDTTFYKYDYYFRLIEFYNNYNKTDEKFSYDVNNLLTEADYYIGGVQRSKFSLTYNSATSVSIASFLYTNGLAGAPGNQTLTLNSKGQVVKNDSGNNLYYLFTYDANGNVLSTSYYSSASLTTPQTVNSATFGTNHHPLSDARGNFGILFVVPIYFANDILTTNTIDNTVKPSSTNTTTNVFQYLDGFPVKETITSTSAPTAINIHYFNYTIPGQ